MKVDRLELRNILAALKPGLAKREFVQQACHFIFSGTDITTFNDKVCISHPFEMDASFSVKGEEFFRLIDGMTDTDVTISLVENKVKVRSKSTTASMATIADDQNTLPAIIETLKKGMKNWQPLPKNFTEGISLCSFSTSNDLTRGVDACVMVTDKFVLSKDTARASLFNMDGVVDDTLFIVGKEAMELSKFPVIEYCSDGKWGHFRTEDKVTFSCALLTGSFPIDKMFPVYENMSKLPHLDFPSDLKSTVDSTVMLADVTSDKSGKFVKIRIEQGEVFVKAENELGWVEKTIRAKYEGEPLDISINSKFLSQILDKATGLACQGNMVHFSSGSFQHIIMMLSASGAPK